MPRCLRRAAALAAFVLLAMPAAPALAQDARGEPSTAYSAVVGFGSALGTLVYSPLKVAYAGTGLVVTSLAFLWTFGDLEVTRTLFATTVGGDYVVTHLEGRRDRRFTGGS